MLKDFSKTLPRSLLDIKDKTRSNIFAWRGQFSPQLIECILEAYCPQDATVLDPFAGSGTVLHEAARLKMAGYAFEVNPAAWIFSKTYEFANVLEHERAGVLRELERNINQAFPVVLFSAQLVPNSEFRSRIQEIGSNLSDPGKILLNALVVLLDLAKNEVTSQFIHDRFYDLARLINSLPYSEKPLNAQLHDARCMPLRNDAVGFVLTSPPYINVFNYHQNYRRSVEVLGWNMLRVARSEIGSNRANRGNRFFTVVQYCLDMASVLKELYRVLKADGRIVFVVGHESRVLSVPFYNAEIIRGIAVQSGLLRVVNLQQRAFTNRFGKFICEDVMSFEKTPNGAQDADPVDVARSVASNVLESAAAVVPTKNKSLLLEALSRVPDIQGTPAFESNSYADYQTHDYVMMP